MKIYTQPKSENYRFLLLFLILMTLLLCYGSVNAQEMLLPYPKKWEAAKGNLKLPSALKITYSSTDKGFSILIEQFKSELLTYKVYKGVTVQASAKAGHIHFIHDTSIAVGNEGYTIKITDTSIEVKYKTAHGAFYATQSLLQMVKVQGNAFKQGLITDEPLYKVRGLMLDVGRRYYEMEYLRGLIRYLGWYKMNTLHIHFTDWSGFRLNSPKYPGLASKESYTKEEIRALQDYAALYHVMIVPEIDVPAHATILTDYRPDFAFKCTSMREARWQGDEANKAGKAWTLDVTRPEVREWIKELMDEFIPWFDAPVFHVGGDEYQYDPEKELCPELMQAMKDKGYTRPGDVFVEWLNDLNQHIRTKHNKQVEIWTWWNFWKNETVLQPDTSIVIDVWNKPLVDKIVAAGYPVIITPEDDLYVTPGSVDAEGYGVVDCKEVYEEWIPMTAPNVLGYKICVWADRAEHHTDRWFEGHAYEPRAVVAEKIWAGKGSANLNEFLKRVNKVGPPPGVLY